MSVWLKDDVYGDLTTPMQKCHGRLVKRYSDAGKNFYVTSRRDGKHSPGSLHYTGNAEDFKRQEISLDVIKATAGKNFDVLEYNDKDIFHVEYDPK